MTLESEFKSKLIKELQNLYPGAVILKTDANQMQGIPDQLILYNDRWAMFEAKRSQRAPCRPNQEEYVELFNEMSFAQFVNPQNKEEFLYELQQALRPARSTRISKRK